MVGTTDSQVITNKTLLTPVLSGVASGTTAGRLGYLAGALSYGNGSVQRIVVNTDESQTLTNKTLTNPTINGATISGTFTGNAVFSGDVTAFSDARLKTDLNVITDALSKVKQLTGYTFKRTDTGAIQTGLIAQDVEKVLPEAVLNTEEYLSLAYGNMVGLLVEAVKELSAKIEKLENK